MRMTKTARLRLETWANVSRLLSDKETYDMSDRPCTCHPDDNPPVPCPQKFALSECKAATQGWKLVPVDPTMGMYDDWNAAAKNGLNDGFFGTWIAAYHAMIDAAPASPETVAWMIVEPGCEYGPTFGTENAAWSALTKAPPGSELVELIRRKA